MFNVKRFMRNSYPAPFPNRFQPFMCPFHQRLINSPFISLINSLYFSFFFFSPNQKHFKVRERSEGRKKPRN